MPHSFNCVTKNIIALDHDISRSIYSQMSSYEAIDIVKQGTSGSVSYDGLVYSGRLRVRSSETPTLKVQVLSERVCPGAHLSVSNEWQVAPYIASDMLEATYDPSRYTSVFKSKSIRQPEWTLTARNYHRTGRYAVEIELHASNENPNGIVAQALRWVHTMFDSVVALRPYLDDFLVRSCRTSSITVKDSMSSDLKGLVYRVKVDGETARLVDGGRMWYVCRPDSTLSVSSWFVSEGTRSFDPKRVTIVRYEQLLDGSTVFIDILCSRGEVQAPSRPYKDSLNEVNRIRNCPRMIVRTDYRTKDDAATSSDAVNLPSDGIIAVDKATRATYRIKEPTVDLIYRKDYLSPGDLEGKTISFSSDILLEESQVYECTLAKVDGYVTVDKLAIRSDKSVPNRYSTVEEVIDRVEHGDDRSHSNPKTLTEYSFALREHVYNCARDARRTGSLIVDVGTGRLQSLSVMMGEGDVYLFCDPNIDLASSPIASKVKDLTLDTNASIASVINRMNSGSTGHGFIKNGSRYTRILLWILERPLQ